MRVSFFISTALLCSSLCFSQNIDKIINVAEVERIERILSADDMQGRKPFTPGIDKAADFIAAEFAKSNLQFFGDNPFYFQTIRMIKAKTVDVNGSLDGETLGKENVLLNTSTADLHVHGMQGYEKVMIKKEDDFNKTVMPLVQSEKNILVLIDTIHLPLFKRLSRVMERNKFFTPFTHIFVLTTNTNPVTLNLHACQG